MEGEIVIESETGPRPENQEDQGNQDQQRPNVGRARFVSTSMAQDVVNVLLETQETHRRELEALIHQMNAPIVALTARIGQYLDMMPPIPQRNVHPLSSSQQGNQRERIPSPTPTPTPPPTTGPRYPSRTPHPRERSAFTPIRETTTYTGENGQSIPPDADNAKLNGLRVPKFHGKDGENVSAWFHKLDDYFLLCNMQTYQKVPIVMSQALRDEAETFGYYLTVLKGESLT